MEDYNVQKHPYCYGLTFRPENEVCSRRCVHGSSGTGMCGRTFRERLPEKDPQPSHINNILKRFPFAEPYPYPADEF